MMTITEALEILRAQGYTVGAPDESASRVRVWLPASDDFVDVQLGRELQDLAEGSLTFDELRAKRATAA